MPKRYHRTTYRQSDSVTTHVAILPPQAEAKYDRQREHECALKPTKHARCLAQNLTDEQNGKRCEEGDSPSEAKRRFAK
jgi:hypothetical protein